MIAGWFQITTFDGWLQPWNSSIRMDFHRIGYSFLFAHVICCYVIQPWNDLLFNTMAGNHFFGINSIKTCFVSSMDLSGLLDSHFLRRYDGVFYGHIFPIFDLSDLHVGLWPLAHVFAIFSNLMIFHSPARKFGLSAGYLYPWLFLWPRLMIFRSVPTGISI